jgi:hypothetical protein
MYRYVVRYDPESFNEVPVEAFRRALSAEIGEWVGGVYHPLTRSPLYKPQTKKRYRLSDEHWRALDPARFAAPVAERAYEREAVLFGHAALLGESAAMQAIVDACAKLSAERDELASWALAEQG